MHVIFTLATVTLRYTLTYAGYAGAAGAVAWVRERFKDHTRTLPDALADAHDRAWQAVGMALAGDSLFARGTDLFHAGDVTAVRNAVRTFLADTTTGFEAVPARTRVLAAGELARLRGKGELARGFEEAPAELFAQLANPAAGLDAAVAAVTAVADALAADAPNLARVLRAGTADGPPLLVTAFLFFFRRAVEVTPELARGLTFDLLHTLARDQARGFEKLDRAAAGLFDQFDTLTRWRAATDHKLDQIIARLELLDQVARVAREYPVSRDLTVPVQVSVAGSRDKTAPAAVKAAVGRVSADELEAGDLAGAGDVLLSVGDLEGAQRMHQTAAELARRDGDTTAEAEARYKAYRDACERGRWPAALAALRRALELAPQRFAPFPLDKYELLGILGAGGFGTVFHCKERLGRREVAVKSLYAGETVRDAETAFREAEVLAGLDHPGVVRVWDKGYADEVRRLRPYLVMEYLPGGTLADRIKTGRLSVEVVLSIARQLAAAMKAAHALKVEGRPLLHRDIKPANVLISELAGGARGELEVKLIDFGLAAPAAGPADAAVTAERTRWQASIVGTLKYASPEQKREIDAPVGPASDVYAFGKTIQEALLGTIEPKYGDWATLPRGLRWQLLTVLEKATQRDPAKRYQSFDALLADIPAPPTSRWRIVAAAVVAAVVVGVAVGAARPATQTVVEVLSTVPPPAPPPPVPPEPFLPPGGNQVQIAPPPRLVGRTPGETKTILLGKTGVPLTLVWVPAGSVDTVYSWFDPRPIRIDRGFWLGQTEVTRGQWQAFHPGTDERPDLPVANLSYDKVTEFCESASSAGVVMRLPTEAEWEYAARAGTTTRWHFGDDAAELPRYAVYDANQTEPVGSRGPNSWGLKDMYGNVAEWCSDTLSTRTGPVRVVRGGSWSGGPGECRSGYRDSLAPHSQSPTVGFRVVVEEPEPR